MRTLQQLAYAALAGLAFFGAAFGSEPRLSLAERFFPERLALAVRQAGDDVVLSWELVGDFGVVGFDVFRAGDPALEPERLNSALLPDSLPNGGNYEYRDTPPAGGGEYAYQVGLTFTDGSQIRSATVAMEMAPLLPSGPRWDGGSRFAASSPVSFSVQEKTTCSEMRKVELSRDAITGNQIKIVVRKEGLYRIGADDMAAKYGVGVEDVKSWIGEEFLGLSSHGEKCSWIPEDGNEGILFYNPGYEDLYTFHNVFWLERESAGLVVPPVSGTPPGGGTESSSVWATKVFEEQLRQEFSRFYPDLDEYWFWLMMQAGNAASNIVFLLDRIDETGEDAKLGIWLQGGSNSGMAGEHHVVVSVNGTEIGRAIWDKNVPFADEFAVPVSVLSNGVNILSLQAILDTGIPYGNVFFDRFSLDYRMKAQASSNYLRLAKADAPEMRVSDCSDPNIIVAEILDARRIRRLDGVRIAAADGGGYSATFAASTSGNMGYVLASEGGAMTPTRVEARPVSLLRATTNGADYLVIAHPILEAEARRLADFRAGQVEDLETRVVLIGDIFDEFSHGMETPEAIRRFLSWVRASWRKAPAYVLLAGEGSFDYKNYFSAFENLVPCLRVDTPYGLYSSDGSLADVEGDDGVPEYSIGRIPASGAAAMSNVVDKIIAHETSPEFPRRVLLVADNPDDAGNFWATADSITDLLPGTYSVEKAYLQAKSANLAACKSTVQSSLNSGAALMVYYGHSAWNRVAGEGILRIDDLGLLTNAPYLATSVLMTCVPNRYEFPQYDYFGEALVLLPGHGAVASWGPSGESLNAFAQIYSQYFFEERRDQPGLRLGDIARRSSERASQSGMVRFMIDVMTLLGDPMTSAF